MVALYKVIACLLSVVSAVQIFPSDRKLGLEEYESIFKGLSDIPTIVLDLSEFDNADLNTPGSVFKYISDRSYEHKVDLHGTNSIEFRPELVVDEEKNVQAFKPKKSTEIQALNRFIKGVIDALSSKYGIVPTVITLDNNLNEERSRDIVEDIEDTVEELLDDLGVLEYLEDNRYQDSDGKHSGEHSGEHRIWTEGLLMCLFVSLVLLGILVIALSWLSSLTISYGALERQTAPSKKTN